MDREEALETLRQLMKETSEASGGSEIEWDEVEAEATIDELGFDSLSMLDLIYDIQQEFDFEFDAGDVAEGSLND